MERDEIKAAVLHEGYSDQERFEAIKELAKVKQPLPKVYYMVALKWLYSKMEAMEDDGK